MKTGHSECGLVSDNEADDSECSPVSHKADCLSKCDPVSHNEAWSVRVSHCVIMKSGY